MGGWVGCGVQELEGDVCCRCHLCRRRRIYSFGMRQFGAASSDASVTADEAGSVRDESESG